MLAGASSAGSTRPLIARRGRVALVTGASSGLGLATARASPGLGAQVVLLGRDRDRTERARDLHRTGDRKR